VFGRATVAEKAEQILSELARRLTAEAGL